MFSGGIERDQWHEIGQMLNFLLTYFQENFLKNQAASIYVNRVFNYDEMKF